MRLVINVPDDDTLAKLFREHLKQGTHWCFSAYHPTANFTDQRWELEVKLIGKPKPRRKR